jgi:hypothetical protein
MGSTVILQFFCPLVGLPLLLCAPHLNSRSFLRKLYKGETVVFTVHQFFVLLPPPLLHLPCAFELPRSPRAQFLQMPIKRVAHKNQMAKKKGANAATSWVPSEFEQANLTKAQKEGFLVEGDQVVFPSSERIPKPPSGYRGDVSCFSSAWSLSPYPRISSWASLYLRRAASPAHIKLNFPYRLLCHSLRIFPQGRAPLDSVEITFLPPPQCISI